MIIRAVLPATRASLDLTPCLEAEEQVRAFANSNESLYDGSCQDSHGRGLHGTTWPLGFIGFRVLGLRMWSE